jgi:translation initiation factor 2 subunit 3
MAVDKIDHSEPETEERLEKNGHESGDEDSDDEIEDIPLVEVDVTNLNPLSPEVISKQVRLYHDMHVY